MRSFEGMKRIAEKAERAGDLERRDACMRTRAKASKLKALEHTRPSDHSFERKTDEELERVIRGGKSN